MAVEILKETRCVYCGVDRDLTRDHVLPWQLFRPPSACVNYTIYSYYEYAAELNRLDQQKDNIGQEIEELRRKQNACGDWEKSAQIQKQIDELEQQFQNLVKELPAAHALDSFTDGMNGAACTLAIVAAAALPGP